MQYSVHSPSPFIQRHYSSLLPDWDAVPQSVLIVLQATSQPLGTSQDITAFKDYWRSRFVAIVAMIVPVLEQAGWRADGFDPKTGYPLRSAAGAQRLDDTAVVKACLGYGDRGWAGCRVVLHPDWADAVYPSVIVTTAPPTILWQYADSLLRCPIAPPVPDLAG